MADCKEIDAALSRLSGKIDALNNKFNGLDNRLKNAESCCDNKNKQDAPKSDNLADILRRLSVLEDVVGKIASYINSLEAAIKTSLNPMKLIANLLNFF
jgi:chromosome segregation ATPase